MSDNEKRGRLFVALDTPDPQRARAIVRAVGERVDGCKIGLELYCSGGAALIAEIVGTGLPVFLDLKFHDIPNTAAGAAAAAARTGASYFTVHACGGAAMIRRAAEAAAVAAAEAGREPPTVLAVTVLTSTGEDELEAIGMAGPCAAATRRLAALAMDAGAGGLVCSPHEVESMRRGFPEATLVVPGIRLADGTVGGDDQTRVATPAQAVARGADLLVVGRPITRAPDPASVVQRIRDEIASARHEAAE